MDEFLLSEIVMNTMKKEYENNENDLADCFLFLLNKPNCLSKLKCDILDWFNDHNRCPYCGSNLTTLAYTEKHTEVDYIQSEGMSMSVCPYCDNQYFS